ncbi:hypothetical protein ACFQX7_01290 [Luedemannella flava]
MDRTCLGRAHRASPPRPLVGHTGGVTSMAIGALDGDPIAVSASRDGTVRVWNLLTGEPVQPVGNPFSGHRGAVAAVALSEIDGQPVVVSGGDDHDPRLERRHRGPGRYAHGRTYRRRDRAGVG